MNDSATDQVQKIETGGCLASLVIDVGLYTGEDTAFYLHRGYRVVAIDANPLMIERAKKRFAAEIAADRLVLLNVGIFTATGDFDFWISSHQDWSSFEKGNASKRNARAYAISVPCISFAEILARYGIPYYLKIDIEKLDGACLEALTKETRPRYVSWEASLGSIQELERMRALGYNAFKCIDQMTLKAAALNETSKGLRFAPVQRVLEKLKRRQVAGWRFTRGHSSGPFGEDTDGPWYSFEEISHDFAIFCARHPFDEHWPTWMDFHATVRTT